MMKVVKKIQLIFIALAVLFGSLGSWYWLCVMGRSFFDIGDTYSILFGLTLWFFGIVLGINIAQICKEWEDSKVEVNAGDVKDE